MAAKQGGSGLIRVSWGGLCGGASCRVMALGALWQTEFRDSAGRGQRPLEQPASDEPFT